MRPSPRLFGLLAMVTMAAQPASAGILRKDNVVNYNVTDISDPSVKYEWDKYPVDPPTTRLTQAYGYALDPVGSPYFVDDQGKIALEKVVGSNKYGSISYYLREYNGHGGGWNVAMEYSPGLYQQPWRTGGPGYSIGSQPPPVSDFNTSGQVVGRIFNDNAVATMLDDQILDHNIADDLHIHLTSADAIDDMGRIIAQGIHDGKAGTYLLTPVGLPVPAPEPSVLAVLGLGGVALVGRAIRRRVVGAIRVR